MPTYNRADRLARLVSALEVQDIDVPFEVVIVDDGSSPETAAELERLAASTSLDLTVIHQDNAGPAVARNAGWREARAPLVAFTDDDCVPSPGWLRALVLHLGIADVIQGRTLPDPAGEWGPWSRTVRAEREDFFATCNVGYRRDVLDRVGGFDTTFRFACDDTDLAERARESGATTSFAADALVHHEVSPSSYRAWLREKPRWVTVPLVVRRHPRIRRLLHRNYVWRATHAPSALAALGVVLLIVALATWSGLSIPLALLGVLALVPYLALRLRWQPLPGVGPRRRVLLLPATLLGDALEVGVVLVGSVRYGAFVL